MKIITHDKSKNKFAQAIFLDGIKVADAFVHESKADAFVEVLQKFVDKHEGKDFVIQNGEGNLGIIVDAYSNDFEDFEDSITVWFEDFGRF